MLMVQVHFQFDLLQDSKHLFWFAIGVANGPVSYLYFPWLVLPSILAQCFGFRLPLIQTCISSVAVTGLASEGRALVLESQKCGVSLCSPTGMPRAIVVGRCGLEGDAVYQPWGSV